MINETFSSLDRSGFDEICDIRNHMYFHSSRLWSPWTSSIQSNMVLHFYNSSLLCLNRTMDSCKCYFVVILAAGWTVFQPWSTLGSCPNPIVLVLCFGWVTEKGDILKNNIRHKQEVQQQTTVENLSVDNVWMFCLTFVSLSLIM